MLSTKRGKEAYIEAVVEGQGYRFFVKVGKPRDSEAVKAGTKLGRGANFRCLMSGAPIDGGYIRAEGMAGRMGARLMGIVAEGDRGRLYLAPTPEHETVAREAKPDWVPDVEFFQHALGFRIGNYGMTKWSDLFTPRQTLALVAFSDLINGARKRIREDAVAAGHPDDDIALCADGSAARAYSEALTVYLGMAVSRMLGGSP